MTSETSESGPPATPPPALVGREAFEALARQPRVFKDLPIEQLGGTVRVQSMNALEFALYQDSLKDESGKPLPVRDRKRLERLAVRAVVGPDGKRLFSEADLEWLSQVLVGVLSRIEDAVSEASGFQSNVAGEIERRKKNSADPGSSDSAGT